MWSYVIQTSFKLLSLGACVNASVGAVVGSIWGYVVAIAMSNFGLVGAVVCKRGQNDRGVMFLRRWGKFHQYGPTSVAAI